MQGHSGNGAVPAAAAVVTVLVGGDIEDVLDVGDSEEGGEGIHFSWVGMKRVRFTA